jgi:Fe-S cluster biogenesis protein NfuA
VNAVDKDRLAARVEEVAHLIASHGGTLSITDVSSDGEVTVRFGGLCTACPLKPLTLAATIRPALLELEGVSRVEAVGVRLSRHAQSALAGAGVPGWPPTQATSE